MFLLVDIRNDSTLRAHPLTLLEALFGEYIILGHGVCAFLCEACVESIYWDRNIHKNDISIEKDVSRVFGNRTLLALEHHAVCFD